MFCLTNYLKLSGIKQQFYCAHGFCDLGIQKGYVGDALFLPHKVLSIGRKDLKSSEAWCWNNLKVYSLMSSLIQEKRSPYCLVLLIAWRTQVVRLFYGGSGLQKQKSNSVLFFFLNKVEDASFLTQLQKPHSITSTTFSWLQASPKPTQIQEKIQTSLLYRRRVTVTLQKSMQMGGIDAAIFGNAVGCHSMYSCHRTFFSKPEDGLKKNHSIGLYLDL